MSFKSRLEFRLVTAEQNNKFLNHHASSKQPVLPESDSPEDLRQVFHMIARKFNLPYRKNGSQLLIFCDRVLKNEITGPNWITSPVFRHAAQIRNDVSVFVALPAKFLWRIFCQVFSIEVVIQYEGKNQIKSVSYGEEGARRVELLKDGYSYKFSSNQHAPGYNNSLNTQSSKLIPGIDKNLEFQSKIVTSFSNPGPDSKFLKYSTELRKQS